MVLDRFLNLLFSPGASGHWNSSWSLATSPPVIAEPVHVASYFGLRVFLSSRCQRVARSAFWGLVWMGPPDPYVQSAPSQSPIGSTPLLFCTYICRACPSCRRLAAQAT